MLLVVVVHALLISVLSVSVTEAKIALGITYYKAKGNRCLTTVPALQTFASNTTTLSTCMVKCYANARCSAFQFLPRQTSCSIYSSISHNSYWSNSVAATAGTCIIFNRRCPPIGTQSQSYNYTSIYWMPYSIFVANSYWYSARIFCLDNRLDMLVVDSQSQLNYMNAHALATDGHWFVGGSINLTTGVTTWVDGLVPSFTIAQSGYPFCTNAVNDGCLFYYNPTGTVYRANCNCNCDPMCGCYEWGL